MKSAVFLLPVALLALAGCDDPMNSGSYQAAPVAQAQNVQTGTIIQMRPVQLSSGPKQSDQIVGTVAGGLIGGLVGNQFGKGSGNGILTAAGAVGGAVAGSKLASQSTVRQSQQWTVRLDRGGTVSVIQTDPNLFVGERVRVIDSGGQVTIAP